MSAPALAERAVAKRVGEIMASVGRDRRAERARALASRPQALSAGTLAGVARWRAERPEGPRAHKRVYHAVRAGLIVKPDGCEQCGREVRLHAHHDDYAKPLQVRWLCGRCHRLVHRALEQGGTA